MDRSGEFKGGGTRRYWDVTSSNKIIPVVSSEKRLNLGLAISPEGKSILYTQEEQAGSELMLVENFH